MTSTASLESTGLSVQLWVTGMLCCVLSEFVLQKSGLSLQVFPKIWSSESHSDLSSCIQEVEDSCEVQLCLGPSLCTVLCCPTEVEEGWSPVGKPPAAAPLGLMCPERGARSYFKQDLHPSKSGFTPI